MSDTPEPRRRWSARIRAVTVGCLIGLAAVSAVASVVATWVDGLVSDTDRYVSTVGPLIDDPAVQEAVSAHITGVVVGELDMVRHAQEGLEAMIDGTGLPPRTVLLADPLATALAESVERRIGAAVSEVVSSPAFAGAWTEANRHAHAQTVEVLTGASASTEIADNTVRVDVAALIAAVKERLVDEGFTRAALIPETQPAFVMVQSDDLGTVQGAFDTLSATVRWLPVLTIGLIVLAVLAAHGRRRSLIASALAVSAAMALLAVALSVTRAFYLDRLDPQVVDPAAARAVFDGIVSGLRDGLRTVLFVALAIAALAYLTAPRGPGETLRNAVIRIRRGLQGNPENPGPVRLAVSEHRRPLQVSAIAVGALAYVTIDAGIGGGALLIAGVTALVLLSIEALRVGAPPNPAGPP